MPEENDDESLLKVIEKLREGDLSEVHILYEWMKKTAQEIGGLHHVKDQELVHETAWVVFDRMRNLGFRPKNEAEYRSPTNYIARAFRNIFPKVKTLLGKTPIDAEALASELDQLAYLEFTQEKDQEDTYLMLFRKGMRILEQKYHSCYELIRAIEKEGLKGKQLLKKFKYKNLNTLYSQKSQCIDRLRKIINGLQS